MGRRPQLAHIQDSINGKKASHLKTAIWIWQLQPCRVLVFAVEFSQLPAAYSTLADVILSIDSIGQKCLNSTDIASGISNVHIYTVVNRRLARHPLPISTPKRSIQPCRSRSLRILRLD